MNFKKIVAAEKEAKEFLKRCAALRVKMQNDDTAKYGCKETASVRRQSMELTHALVDVRQSSGYDS